MLFDGGGGGKPGSVAVPIASQFLYAAASFTAVPRSLAAAISPTLSGALFAAGWISLPLVACGLLKITYDLALWRAMRRDRLEGD